MTLQQLKYLVAIAEYGSINAAAHNLYASQSNLSTAIKELEQEFGITIFRRTNRGVTLTNEGTELVAYARQVLEQAEMLELRYSGNDDKHARLAVSAQHYAFCVQAFIQAAEQCTSEEYDFILRETATGDIIEDVKSFRADIGVLYTDSFNERVLSKAFEEAGLDFYPLFEASVHVFVGQHHPLANNKVIKPEELDDYPRYAFEQGHARSFYFSEEPFGHLPHKRNIRFSDRGTLTNLLTTYNGYTFSTGVLSDEMHSGIVSIPLDVDEKMKVGYLLHKDRKPSALCLEYIEHLKAIVQANPTVTSYLGDV